MMSDNKILDL